jgi:hypothetical protein
MNLPHSRTTIAGRSEMMKSWLKSVAERPEISIAFFYDQPGCDKGDSHI